MNTTYQCGHSEDRDFHFTAHPMFHESLAKAFIDRALLRPCEDCRQRAEAPEQCRILRKVIADLGDSYSHISYRSWCGRNQLHVYARRTDSPSGCLLAATVEDSEATQAILVELGKRAQQGGLMGEQACRAGMR